MTVRRLDDSGDIATSGAQFISGIDEVAQTVLTRLRLFYGEYFRDVTDGTQWFEAILGKNGSQQAREAALRTRIAQTPGVVRLTSFEFDFDIENRKATVTAGILTTYGETTVTHSNG